MVGTRGTHKGRPTSGAGSKPALRVRWELRSGVEYWAESVPSAGRYHTFVFVAADILAIVEPVRAGALARECVRACLPRILAALSAETSVSACLGRPRNCESNQRRPHA